MGVSLSSYDNRRDCLLTYLINCTCIEDIEFCSSLRTRKWIYMQWENGTCSQVLYDTENLVQKDVTVAQGLRNYFPAWSITLEQFGFWGSFSYCVTAELFLFVISEI